MENLAKRNEQIFEDLKDCFTEIGLPITSEYTRNKRYYMDFNSEIKHDIHPVEITVTMIRSMDMVRIVFRYEIDKNENEAVLYELFSRINYNLTTSHFLLDENSTEFSRNIILQSGMHFMDDGINKQAFHMVLKQLLSDNEKFAPLIWKQLESDEKPEVVIRRFLDENKDIAEEFIYHFFV